MGKKVLLIMGSPRKGGNSDVLCEAFAKGAREAGHDAEKICVQDLDLTGCRACYGCEGTGKCVISDDMGACLEKMIQADVIVLATPVYFYSMSGQMKMFLDRTMPGVPMLKDKEFYFMIAAADDNSLLDRAMDALAGFTDCLPNAKVMGRIYGGNYLKAGAIAGSEVEREAYEMGKKA